MHENLSAVSARHSFLRRFTNFLFFTGWLCPAVIFFGCRNPCFFLFQFHKGIIQNQPFSLGEHCKIKPALKVADKRRIADDLPDTLHINPGRDTL